MEHQPYTESSGLYGARDPFDFDMESRSPDYESPDNDLPSSSDATSPTSEISSQWTDGPSDVFDELERQLEHPAGIIDDGRLLPPHSDQHHVQQVFLSPQCLAQVPSSTAATYVVYRAPDVEIQARVDPIASSARRYMSTDATSRQARLLISHHASSHRPRPGRGRAKLPKEQLKKTQREHNSPEKCTYCGKGHKWKRDLIRHLGRHHKPRALADRLITEKDLERTPCPYCPRVMRDGTIFGNM